MVSSGPVSGRPDMIASRVGIRTPNWAVIVSLLAVCYAHEIRTALCEPWQVFERTGGSGAREGRRGSGLRLHLDSRARRRAARLPVEVSLLADRADGLGARGFSDSRPADLAGLHRVRDTLDQAGHGHPDPSA